MDLQQCGIQEDAMCRVDSICGCNVGDKGDNDNTVNRSTDVDNIETEGTGTVSSIVRACNTDISHQNRLDDLD